MVKCVLGFVVILQCGCIIQFLKQMLDIRKLRDNFEEVKVALKKRGFDNHNPMAQNMCNLWAAENGVEREFGTDGKPLEPVRLNYLDPRDTDYLEITY